MKDNPAGAYPPRVAGGLAGDVHPPDPDTKPSFDLSKVLRKTSRNDEGKRRGCLTTHVSKLEIIRKGPHLGYQVEEF
jgi:hypothetical protein